MISIQIKEVIPSALNYKQPIQILIPLLSGENYENHLLMGLFSPVYIKEDSICSTCLREFCGTCSMRS